jgi:hypothetical protein
MAYTVISMPLRLGTHERLNNVRCRNILYIVAYTFLVCGLCDTTIYFHNGRHLNACVSLA